MLGIINKAKNSVRGLFCGLVTVVAHVSSQSLESDIGICQRDLRSVVGMYFPVAIQAVKRQ
jgi:hypothetical protein